MFMRLPRNGRLPKLRAMLESRRLLPIVLLIVTLLGAASVRAADVCAQAQTLAEQYAAQTGGRPEVVLPNPPACLAQVQRLERQLLDICRSQAKAIRTEIDRRQRELVGSGRLAPAELTLLRQRAAVVDRVSPQLEWGGLRLDECQRIGSALTQELGFLNGGHSSYPR